MVSSQGKCGAPRTPLITSFTATKQSLRLQKVKKKKEMCNENDSFITYVLDLLHLFTPIFKRIAEIPIVIQVMPKQEQHTWLVTNY